jgi:predicted permease
MSGEILNIILPIFSVLLLGYAAGRANQFDSHQVAGINELVLKFALPASLFVGTVSVPRTLISKIQVSKRNGLANKQVSQITKSVTGDRKDYE